MSDALLTCPPISGSSDSLQLLAVISKNDLIKPNANPRITVPSSTSVILISIFMPGDRLSFVGTVTPKMRLNIDAGYGRYISAIFESDNNILSIYVDEGISGYANGSNVLLLCF